MTTPPSQQATTESAQQIAAEKLERDARDLFELARRALFAHKAAPGTPKTTALVAATHTALTNFGTALTAQIG